MQDIGGAMGLHRSQLWAQVHSELIPGDAQAEPWDASRVEEIACNRKLAAVLQVTPVTRFHLFAKRASENPRRLTQPVTPTPEGFFALTVGYEDVVVFAAPSDMYGGEELRLQLVEVVEKDDPHCQGIPLY